jgi:hypothetical protein
LRSLVEHTNLRTQQHTTLDTGALFRLLQEELTGYW